MLSKTPKEECEDLMNAVVPLAQEMLSKHREFFPFGGAMSPSGEIIHVGGWTGQERPESSAVIKLLEGSLREGAAKGKYKATALVVDVRTVPPGKSAKQDAIAISLDHRDGYSVQVMIPYTFGPAGALQLDEPFAARGEGGIFKK